MMPSGPPEDRDVSQSPSGPVEPLLGLAELPPGPAGLPSGGSHRAQSGGSQLHQAPSAGSRPHPAPSGKPQPHPAPSGGSRPHRPLVQQPSLFGVVASDPVPEDLVGLLAGPGTVQRMGGTARVSVAVDAGWRVHALLAEFALRDLPASWEPLSHGYLVRTAYTTRLLELARSWQDGPPSGLHLGGQALRLWVVAAGSPVPDADAYLLGLGVPDGRSWPEVEATWSAVGAALAAAGLSAALVIPGSADESRYAPAVGSRYEGQRPGERQPPEEHQSGEIEPAEGRAGQRETAEGRAGQRETAEGRAGQRETADGRAGEREAAESRVREREAGEDRPGEREPGKGQPGERAPGEHEPGEGHPREHELREHEPGDHEPGAGQSGEREPAEGQPTPEGRSAPEAEAGRHHRPPWAGRVAGYRVTGRRRLARLAELVGDPPPSAPPGHWPTAIRPPATSRL